MWNVEYKPDNVTQTWTVLSTYDDKTSALIMASHVSTNCYMVVVKAPDGSVVWSN